MKRRILFDELKRVFIYFIILLIVDYTGILDMYEQHFVRRIINMYRRRDALSYGHKLKPFCQNLKGIIDSEDVAKMQSIALPTTTDTPWFSRAHVTTHQCCDKYSERDIEIMQNVSENIKAKCEKAIGMPLYLMNSKPKIYVYRGKNSKHLWHVDPRNIDTIYNVIMCINKKGRISPFQYKNKLGEVKSIHFQPGDAALFKGGTTIHQVPPNDDPDSERTVLSLAFTSDPDVAKQNPRTLCTFIEGGNNKLRVLGLCVCIFILNAIASNISGVSQNSYKVMVAVLSISLLLNRFPPHICSNIGSKRRSSIYNNILLCVIFMLITFSIKSGGLFFSYFLLSDVLLPSKRVAYD